MTQTSKGTNCSNIRSLCHPLATSHLPQRAWDPPVQVLPCSCRPRGKGKSQDDFSYVDFPFFKKKLKSCFEWQRLRALRKAHLNHCTCGHCPDTTACQLHIQPGLITLESALRAPLAVQGVLQSPCNWRRQRSGGTVGEPRCWPKCGPTDGKRGLCGPLWTSPMDHPLMTISPRHLKTLRGRGWCFCQTSGRGGCRGSGSRLAEHWSRPATRQGSPWTLEGLCEPQARPPCDLRPQGKGLGLPATLPFPGTVKRFLGLKVWKHVTRDKRRWRCLEKSSFLPVSQPRAQLLPERSPEGED